MSRRQILGIIFLLLLAALLAPAVFAFFQEFILAPVAYLWWLFKLVLRAVPQAFFWYLLISITALVALGSLMRSKGVWPEREEKPIPKKGAVKRLAEDFSRIERGIYFKWSVANRLARTAHAILIHNNGEKNVPSDALQAPGWDPPEAVRAYLDAGLRQSMSDYPPRKFFSPKSKTPFDTDVEQVVHYLESQME